MAEKVKESEKLGVGKTNILITGLPGLGKTTVFRRLVGELRHLNPVGFFTAEIRKGGRRKGFSLSSLDGRTGILAHVDFRTGYQVGKYGVDVAGFETFIGPLPVLIPKSGLVMIDEIGKMECLSKVFVETVRQLFFSDRSVLASIAQKGSGLISEVKNNPETRIFYLTPENRKQIVEDILPIFAPLKK